ncbi:MAG: DUF6804 family protein [Mycetocola sp.]
MTVAKAVDAKPGFTRPALAPGILAAVVLMIGVAFVDSSWFIVVNFMVTILAAVVAWFALQAKAWWWLLVFVPVIVLWNPVLPLGLSGDGWFAAQLIAPIFFVAAGVAITVPVADEARRAR